MSSTLFVRLLRGGLLAAVASLAIPTLAAADAPDITSAAGSVASDGKTVTITGSWAWTTHHSDCNQDRAGVGIAIDWNDPNAAGNHVTTLNGVSIDVGTPSDNNVHTTSGGTGSSFTCGTFNGNYNTGSFGGMTHTYTGPLPASICALSYDVHGKNGSPSGGGDTVAGGSGHNNDNSAEKNGQTPAGNVCTEVKLPPPPSCTSNCGPPGPGAPAISLAKAGPASATAGSDVAFTLTVTNPGAQPLTNITISDPRCNASAPTLQTKSGDASPNTLDPGDTWVYTCSAHTASTDTTLHNDSTVTGTPPSGPNVTATASADVPLVAQGVLGLQPGVARLRGPTGCVSRRTHVLTVRGSRIARVSFYLDGRYIGTRTRPNRGTAYTVTIRGTKLRRGSHIVTARITYLPDSNPQTKTLQLSFARCARAVTPKFTG